MNEGSAFTCVDIGVNLTHPSLVRHLDDVLQAAKDAGVVGLVAIGCDLAGSRKAAALAADHPDFVVATAGVHPHDAKSCDDTTLPALRTLLAQERVRAMGECGLDFNRDFSPRPVQERWFEAQVELACELGLPLYLHERDAHARMLAILSRHRARFEKAVIHCFTGTKEELFATLDLDLHIGITGWLCDERRGRHLQELVAEIPVERLMVETDSPFLAPRDLRPRARHNEPKNTPHILATVARLRGEEVRELAPRVLETTRRFWGAF